MKNYLSFNLTGGKIFLCFFVYLLASILNSALSEYGTQVGSDYLSLVGLLIIILPAIYYYFCFTKYSINAISYRDFEIACDASLGEFTKIYLIGLLLSVVTIGIYTPWFIKKLVDYFASKTHINGKELKFNGDGGSLFVYMFVTIFIMFLSVIGISLIVYYGVSGMNETIMVVILSIIAFMSLTALTFLCYKWNIDFKYDNYAVKYKGGDLQGILFVTGQVLLTCITAGLYTPMFIIKFYRHYVVCTEVSDENGNKVGMFGFDTTDSSDFFYILGQVLLLIVTLGIYTPWAYCSIYKLLISKTYYSENN